MITIEIGKASDPNMTPALIDGMFRLRHEIFHCRLGWQVNSVEGREQDGFDNDQTIYTIAHDEGEVIACWRLLPTQHPYMLSDTFPQLLRGEPAPRESDVWELSRFAVLPTGPEDRRQAHASAVTLRMMEAVARYGREHGIRSYVTVTSVAVERLTRGAGVTVRRFGDGKASRIGKVLSVACWLDVEESLVALSAQLSELDQLRHAA